MTWHLTKDREVRSLLLIGPMHVKKGGRIANN